MLTHQDYEDIRCLMAEYAQLIDRADFSALGKLLDGALYGTEETLRPVNAETLRDWCLAVNIVHPDGSMRTCHTTSNVAIRPDGGGAAARADSYYVVLQETARLPLQPIVAGRYKDRFTKADGRWRFAQRAVIVDLIGDTSEHLKGVDLRKPIRPDEIMQRYNAEKS